jgi:hypothetical protein
MYELPVQGQKKSNATRLNMALDSGIAGAEAAAQCDGERVVAQSHARRCCSAATAAAAVNAMASGSQHRIVSAGWPQIPARSR